MTDELHDKLRQCIQDVVNLEDLYEEGEKGLVTKWMIIADVAGIDGNRTIYTHYDNAMMTWEVQGLLHHVLYREVTRGEWIDKDDD